MKRPFPLLAALLVSTSATFAGSFGPGPWASGSYYPGGTDGKYQASVTGNNITGVIGFSIREGGPSTITPEQQNQQNAETDSAASSTIAAATATTQVFDETQNYFVIFVEGRTYTGLAVASVNPVNNSVVGSLLGAQPDFGYQSNNFTDIFLSVPNKTNLVVTTNPATTNTSIITNVVVTNVGGLVVTNSVITTNVTVVDPERITNAIVTSGDLPANQFDPLPVLNRGSSGGWQAQLQNKGATMTFVGNGQLSSPAQAQRVDLVTNNGQLVGQIVTDTVDFFVSGLRTSFSTALTVTDTTTQ